MKEIILPGGRLMKLCRETLPSVSTAKVAVPCENIFSLPEKVLQFGTGRLLRGLPDYFIDKANKAGLFNGRIVMVKSTSRGDATDFQEQDGLYTLCERGIVGGEKTSINIINASVSRVLTAQNEWEQVLECAHNKKLAIIISNTTEAGIQLVNDDIHSYPPISFPGKLLAFLYERFIAFHGSKDSGLVIVPTELILNNGKELESIVTRLAQLNSLGDDFIEWMRLCNYFCNSLVDRIVTGMPDKEIQNAIEKELGYTDELLIISEVYSLWAIESDEKIKNVLSFAEADDSVVIEQNIDLYRELKLRLLNGTHTLTCGLAFLANYSTVQKAMEDKISEWYIAVLMRNEIAPSIPLEINDSVKTAFISKVLDRFRNPHIHHHWINITLNYSAKMKLRCIPLLINFYRKYEDVPQLFALGFASYLYFMKSVKQNGKEFYGEFMNELYLVQDDMAEKYHVLWKTHLPEDLVTEVLKDVSFWEHDLSQLPGFQQAVTGYLNSIMINGMKATLEKVYHKIPA